MTLPELEEFKRQLARLVADPAIAERTGADGRLSLSRLRLDDVSRLMASEVSYYFLLAATELNRTSLRRASQAEEALLLPPRQRKAFAVQARLPVSATFDQIAANATALRHGDLQRKARGQAEQVLRDRLVSEGIPLLMSPPRRVVPGVVISGRKPDGVWPDPATGAPPILYLEVKRIRRVSDDIQKRLYELAEAALEMKLLYGRQQIHCLGLEQNQDVARPDVPQRLREQITGRPPFVVGLFLCPRAEAERYRVGAESFIDRIFFQEEIEDCLTFIDEIIKAYPIG